MTTMVMTIMMMIGNNDPTISPSYTFDSICEIAFGKKMGTLHKQHPFCNAFDKGIQITVKRFFDPTWYVV